MNPLQYLSIKQIFRQDYLSHLCILTPLTILGLIILSLFIPTLPLPFLIACGMVSLILAPPILILRYLFFRRVYQRGVMVEGQIKELFFQRGRGRISYTYAWQGQEWNTKNFIMKTNLTRTFAPGQTVTVVADSQNPKNAFIVELYQ